MSDANGNGHANGHAPHPLLVLPPPIPDRIPPQNLVAEKGVLGSMMLDNATIDDVLPVLDASEFYRDGHQILYRAICDTRSAGLPCDTITIEDRLRASDEWDKIGGADGFYDILGSVPHAANARYYAQIVKEKAVARELIELHNRGLDEGYSDSLSAGEKLESTQARVFALAAAQSGPGAGPTAAADEGVRFLADLEAMRESGERRGVGSGWRDADELLGGSEADQLVIVAARPSMGKTALAIQWAMNVAEQHTLPSAYFSLEMSRSELLSRMLVARSRVDSHKLRSPKFLGRHELDALGAAQADLRDLPKIFIHDPLRLTIPALAATARRLKDRHGIGIVFVDYLQLLVPPSGKSRQEEVAAIGRGLKEVSRELGVPVVALSQLNRASEGREDRRPRLADLRECVAGDQLVYDARTGNLRRVDECTEEATSVYSLDDRSVATSLTTRRGVAVPFWSTGIKPVFKLTTRTGRTIRCTANHPLRTIHGWRRLDQLEVGRRIAVPRVLPQPFLSDRPGVPLTSAEARLLGYLICDGTYIKHRSVGYVKADMEMVDEVCRIARERFGIEAKDHACPGDSRQVELTAPQKGPGCNPIINWLRDLGIHGQYSHEKTVPGLLLGCPNPIVAEFLGTLWAGDGSIVPRRLSGWVLKFTSTSRTLLAQVQMLLLRFGIISRLGRPERNTKSKVDIATLSIADAREIVRFSEAFRLPGTKGRRLLVAAEDCRSVAENARIDRLPIEVTSMVEGATRQAGMSWLDLGYRCQGKEMHRDTLARVAARLGDPGLEAIASSDVLWDRVVSIEPDGECETFDTRVNDLHNFVVGGVFAHNSGELEQAAHAVVLLHRPAYYDPNDSPGIAEFIVAKNRNGATGTTSLLFTKHCMRFDDPSPAEPPPEDLY